MNAQDTTDHLFLSLFLPSTSKSFKLANKKPPLLSAKSRSPISKQASWHTGAQRRVATTILLYHQHTHQHRRSFHFLLAHPSSFLPSHRLTSSSSHRHRDCTCKFGSKKAGFRGRRVSTELSRQLTNIFNTFCVSIHHCIYYLLRFALSYSPSCV